MAEPGVTIQQRRQQVAEELVAGPARLANRRLRPDVRAGGHHLLRRRCQARSVGRTSGKGGPGADQSQGGTRADSHGGPHSSSLRVVDDGGARQFTWQSILGRDTTREVGAMDIFELTCDRRTAMMLAAGVCLGGGRLRAAADERASRAAGGRVEGHPEGAKAGEAVLAAGGNAVDAAVTAALVAGVVSPQNCGVGGYGGHMVVATADGRTVVGIDFNSAAPAAARPDMFPLDAGGKVRDQANMYGWRAAGVPGTLAGLQHALDRYGTRKFAAVA